MTDIAVTAARVSLVNEFEPITKTGIAAVAIAKGEAVAYNTSGLLVLADASSGSDNGARGVALVAAAIGEPCTYVVVGTVNGFTLTGADYGDAIYLSNTAGALDDATGGDVSVQVGSVVPQHDGTTPSKLLFVNCLRNM